MNTVTAPHNGKLRTFNLSSNIQHLQFADGSGWVPGLSGSDPNDDSDVDAIIDDPTATDDITAQTLKVMAALNSIHKKQSKIISDLRDKLTAGDLNAPPKQVKRLTATTTLGSADAHTVSFTGDVLTVNTELMHRLRSQYKTLSRK
jgi:hypothetical protein